MSELWVMVLLLPLEPLDLFVLFVCVVKCDKVEGEVSRVFVAKTMR